MAAALEDIAKKEGFLLDHDAADMLAVMGDGSMRDSISLLDRAWSGSFHVTKDRVAEALGLAREQEIESIFKSRFKVRCTCGRGRIYLLLYGGKGHSFHFRRPSVPCQGPLPLQGHSNKPISLCPGGGSWRPALSESCSLKRLEGFSEDLSFFLSRVTRNSAAGWTVKCAL